MTFAITPPDAGGPLTWPTSTAKASIGRSARRSPSAGQGGRISEGLICRPRSLRGDPGCARRDTAAALKSWRLATPVADRRPGSPQR